MSDIVLKPSKKESVPKEEVKITEFKFDKEKCKLHLDTVENEIFKQFKGKSGMNPYMWITRNIVPLRRQLIANISTSELQNKILNLKVVEPRI